MQINRVYTENMTISWYKCILGKKDLKYGLNITQYNLQGQVGPLLGCLFAMTFHVPLPHTENT